MSVAPRVTTPAALPPDAAVVITPAGEADHSITVPLSVPSEGSVMLPRMSPALTISIASRSCCARTSAPGMASTVAGKERVSDAAPRVSVAVSVTAAGVCPAAGRVTTPVAEIAAGLLDDHAIVDPFAPLAGRVMLAVRPERSPSDRAAASRCSRVASVGTSAVTSEAESAAS